MPEPHDVEDVPLDLIEVLGACRLAGRHLLNALLAVGVQPESVPTQAEAIEFAWPTSWAYDAWVAWHAMRVIVRRAGMEESELYTDHRSGWRTAAKHILEIVPVEVAPVRRARVLVVDDEKLHRQVLAIDLEYEGYEVAEAKNAAEAEVHLQSGVPDLVILDVYMPGTGGLELLRHMRSDAALAGVPVVILTVADAPEVEDEARDSGADRFLTKPVDPEVLIALIGNLIRERAG